MIKTEKTCRLGKDFPLVSFFSSGVISHTSYGLGAEYNLRNSDKNPKETAGIMISQANAGVLLL